MSLKAADIISWVRRKIKEPDESDSRFSDNEEPGIRPSLVGLINDAIPEVCEQVRYCRKAVRIQGTGGSAYPLPEDLLEIEEVTSLGVSLNALTIRDSAPYSPLEPLQANIQAGGYGYLVKGGDIFFLPVLTQGENRVIHYLASETPIDDKDSVLEAPRTLRDVYGHHVLSACMEVARDSFWADRYYEKFLSLARRRRAAEVSRQHPGLTKMRAPRAW